MQTAWSVINTLRPEHSVDIVKDGSISKCEGTTIEKVIQEYPEEM